MRHVALAVMLAAVACGGKEPFRHALFTIEDGQARCAEAAQPLVADWEVVCRSTNIVAHGRLCAEGVAYLKHDDGLGEAETCEWYGTVDGWRYIAYYDGCAQ